jgi:hypothetical protein
MQMENGNGELPFVCCKLKQKAEVGFLGQQTIIVTRGLLFQQMCPSMEAATDGSPLMMTKCSPGYPTYSKQYRTTQLMGPKTKIDNSANHR